MKAQKLFPLLNKLKDYARNLMTIRKHYIHQMGKFTEFLGGYEENTLLLAPVKQNNLLFFDPEKIAV